MIKRFILIFVGCLLPTHGGANEAFPNEFYSDRDALKDTKKRMESYMGLYLTAPPRRHRSERIVIRRKSVRFDVWHPIGQNTDLDLKNRAVKWLVFGRTQYAKGAQGILSDFPEFKQVVLRFHTVTRVGQKGRRRSKKPDKIRRYLALVIDRSTFERLPIDTIRLCIEQNDCSREFKTLFTKSLFRKRYVARKRKES